MSGFGRKAARQQAKNRMRNAIVARKTVIAANTKLTEEHKLELATLPAGWTSVRLEGTMRPVPDLPLVRPRAGGRPGPRRLGGIPAPKRPT